MPPKPILEGGLDNDIVIPVIGPTKAGKSSFLNRLIGPDQFVVGTTLTSRTTILASHIFPREKVPQSLHPVLGNRRIVLLDTPGFDSTTSQSGSDGEVLGRIAEGLRASYKNDMRVGGVLYLHDISRDDFARVASSLLERFSILCGGCAMDQIAFATTKWDGFGSADEKTKRVEELCAVFWKKMIDHGATVYRVQPPAFETRITQEHREPWDIIHDIVAYTTVRDTEYIKRLLQIQDEIISQRPSLPKTGAGREPDPFEALLATGKDLMRRAREDAKAGRPMASLQKQKEDIEKLTAQLKAMKLKQKEDIEKLTAQLKATKLPGLTHRVMRFMGCTTPEAFEDAQP